MDIKKLIVDTVKAELPGIVRDIVRSDMGVSSSTPVKRISRSQPVPRAATAIGVRVGQRWKGKGYASSAGRVIEIAEIGQKKVVPKVIKAVGKRAVAKGISYETLRTTYELVK